MQKIKFSDQIETTLLVAVAVICVAIPLFDFIGVLENVAWIHARLPIYILLSFGLLSTYLVSHLNNKEARDVSRNQELLNSIKIDEQRARFMNLLENIWNNRESDINRLFDEVESNVGNKIDLLAACRT